MSSHWSATLLRRQQNCSPKTGIVFYCYVVSSYSSCKMRCLSKGLNGFFNCPIDCTQAVANSLWFVLQRPHAQIYIFAYVHINMYRLGSQICHLRESSSRNSSGQKHFSETCLKTVFIAFYSCESDFNFHFVDSLQLTYAQTVEAHYFRSYYVVRLLAVSFFVLLF